MILVAASLAAFLSLDTDANAAIIAVEPDAFAVGTVITNAYSGVTLSVEGKPGSAVQVLACIFNAYYNSPIIINGDTNRYGTAAGSEFNGVCDHIKHDLLNAAFPTPFACRMKDRR